jgi:myo-inositol catabolism protein IolC
LGVAVATAAQARRVGDANCIVLGAAAVPERVAKWLRVAAATDGFHGFAIGRNIWRDALQRWVRDEISRDDAIAVIARGYLSTIAVYTGGRA